MSPDGGPTVVSFPAPTATGPAGVTTTCVPASGTSFQVGTTNVTCTARAGSQQSSCSFSVTVQPPPRLDLTNVKFMAFGDSITFGALTPCPRPALDGSLPSIDEDRRSLRTRVLGPAYSYPAVLHGMLRARYVAQAPVVENEGLGGELVTENEARDRAVAAMDAHRPGVLLLQEGINDLHGFGQDAVTVIPAALAGIVRQARIRSIRVFVGTLLPERVDGCRAHTPALVAPTNDRIRIMAVAEGADLVDLHAVFVGQTGVLLGQDGLHPNEAGYAAIAKAFADAIQQKLERPVTGLTFAPARPW
jgi:lysophospholipase L1-like esterase